MSALNHLFDLPDQICYVQCGFCTTILLVSVPCSSLSMLAVTVRCGHCSCLLSVNMMKASFVPLHLLASLTQDEQREELCLEEVDKQNNRPLDMRSPSMVVSNSDNEEEDTISMNPIVNKRTYWAQFPPIQYKGDGPDGESCTSQREENMTWDSDVPEAHEDGKVFRERKAPRHSIWARTPFE
ncbi:hypothetical protein ACE6H2_002638 [Prunus campanulata]